MSPETRQNLRKQREGVVVRNAMEKTVVVRVDRRVRHRMYGKEITRSKMFYVHDGDGIAQIGDIVRIMETRPLSKLKRWRLVDVLRSVDR